LKKYLLVLLTILPLGALFSQVPGDNSPWPQGFDTILLGDPFEIVQQKLTESPLYRYRGAPDVSLLEEPNTTLIETRGLTYIQWASFQFYEDRLYIITLELDPRELDHYTMYTRLREKYGDSSDLNPQAVRWEGPGVLISLERPLTLKFIDSQVLKELQQKGRVEEAYEEVNREDFLNKF